jgi:hypothetical protein
VNLSESPVSRINMGFLTNVKASNFEELVILNYESFLKRNNMMILKQFPPDSFAE